MCFSVPVACTITQNLFLPVQSPPAQHVVKTKEENGYEQQYRHERFHAHLAEIDGVGVEKDHFDIKKHEKYGHHEVLDGHRNTGIALRFDTALEVFIFLGALATWPKHGYHDEYDGNEAQCYERLEDDRHILRRFHSQISDW